MHATELSKLKTLADLVRREDPAIASAPLFADGRLLKQNVRLDHLCKEIAAHLAACFRGLREDDFPMHYCAWGKARVGSTALNNLFGLAGFPSYYQPVKAQLRTASAGLKPEPWVLLPADKHPRIFSKETQGPYTLAECLFIPAQILIEAGYPASKLHLIVLERDPERALASWLNKFHALQPPEVLVQHYVLAALNANRVRRYAHSQGIPVTHYVYEASKEPVLAARGLFARLGLSHLFHDWMVTDWGDRGELDSSTGHQIIYPSEPEMYSPPGLHGSDSGYRYRNGGTAVSEQHRRLLEITGVYQMYEDAVESCVSDLGLDERASEKLFGNRRAADFPIELTAFPTAEIPSRVNDLEIHPS